MDWKYKHFNQEALFKASRQDVLAAARSMAAESLGGIEDTTDGFVARGRSGWHTAIATYRITPVPDGTRVAVELAVERASMWGYMLFDAGGYYNRQIDKWFLSIAQHLAGPAEQNLISKTTSSSKVLQGCFIGCLVNVVVGACLVTLAIPLDNALFRQSSGPFQDPFSVVASLVGVVAGVVAFLYVVSPDAPALRFIHERLQRIQKRGKPPSRSSHH